MDSASPPLVERRIHRVFITRNTEYHTRRGVCIAVRDRRSGQWIWGHMAFGHTIQGALRNLPEGGIRLHGGMPEVGESIVFWVDGRDLVTSPVMAIERPPREIVAIYPELPSDG
ncbi:MAG: hypothetical protein NZM37_08830 [Sandaracinaceae bacterium]|nr:hypothetical protein [Sandaracinaceae bacterium]